MKKSQFGIVLFLVGSLGYLVLSLYIAENPQIYNNTEGILITLQITKLLTPYIVFCIIGITGLAISIYEFYK